MRRATFIVMGLFAAALKALGNDLLHNVVDDAWVGPVGCHFSGRMTEVRPAPAKDERTLRTLYRNTRLLFTSGEEGVVTWRVGALEWSLRADDHGYWELATNQPLGLGPGWHSIETVPSSSSEAGLLVPDPRNTFGLISDIDDTVMVSHVLRTRKLLRNSLTLPAERRDAVEGMAALYRRLLAQNPAPESSPVFYVSSSPRQLTDTLRRFLRANDFPRGVLQLKEISTERGDSLRDKQTYKLRHIETIIAAYPDVKFALMGDDGEADPEIYAKIQAKFPAQVVGIWIRRVHHLATRARLEGQRDMAELLQGEASPR
jgi:phosphatidate phosphatase APP1